MIIFDREVQSYRIDGFFLGFMAELNFFGRQESLLLCRKE
jgi:hypothetical protein